MTCLEYLETQYRTPLVTLSLRRDMSQRGGSCCLFMFTNCLGSFAMSAIRLMFLCCFFLKIYLFIFIYVYEYTVAVFRHTRRSHYGWLWATMWVMGFELRTSGRAVSALNHWAISPAQYFFLKRFIYLFYVCEYTVTVQIVVSIHVVVGHFCSLWSARLVPTQRFIYFPFFFFLRQGFSV